MMSRFRDAMRVGSWTLAIGETVLIFVLLFIYGGRPAPEVNEAHYLAKAKHYWNPAWCPGDHFLESADAHQSFYWLFGWLTLLVSLPVVACVGRIVTWLLLAISWRALSWAIVPRAGFALLSAALWIGGVEHLHMAGEWVVGGVEAKGFAYALLLWGLERMVRGRWLAVWPLLGAAAGLHVLVGGWAVIAAGLAWLATPKRAPLVSMLPSLAVGFLLSLPGLLPAVWLTWDAPAELVAQANEIYVQGRLSHHLLISAFPREFITRQLSLLAVFLLFAWLVRRDGQLMLLVRFVLGTVIIASCGALLEWALQSQPELKYSLLRFYWFRLSDVMLPAGAALSACVLVARLRTLDSHLASWLQGGLLLLAMFGAGKTIYYDRTHPLPAADQRASHMLDYGDWRRVCDWIANNTRPDDCVLTPSFQQTFKWYAGRGEVATYKDVPQDATGIVQWRERFRDRRDFWVAIERQNARLRDLGLADNMAAERQQVLQQQRETILKLAQRYNFQYILAIRGWAGPSGGKLHLALERVYPNNLERNDHYVVYRVPLPPRPTPDQEPAAATGADTLD